MEMYWGAEVYVGVSCEHGNKIILNIFWMANILSAYACWDQHLHSMYVKCHYGMKRILSVRSLRNLTIYGP
jgi:hypothetical protein